MGNGGGGERLWGVLRGGLGNGAREAGVGKLEGHPEGQEWLEWGMKPGG